MQILHTRVFISGLGCLSVGLYVSLPCIKPCRYQNAKQVRALLAPGKNPSTEHDSIAAFEQFICPEREYFS